MIHIENPDVLCDNPFEGSCEIIYYTLIKVEDENNGYGLVTFLVSHEHYGYFKVTEEIEADSPEDVATYYKRELEGMNYDWSRHTEDKWQSLYEAKEIEFVNLD